MNLPQSSPFLGNYCKGVKIIHFSSDTSFGQLLNTFGDFYLVTLVISYDDYCIQNSINLKLQYFESKISTLSSNSFLVFIRPFPAPFSLFLSIQYSWQ